MVKWKSKSNNPPKTDTFIEFYLFVLYSITCLKICHFTACFTSLWTSFLFSMLILHVTSSRFCSYLVNKYHFSYTSLHAHTEAHTHEHTCTISTQEEWREPDTGAWSRGAEQRLLLETKALLKVKKREGERNKKVRIFRNLKKKDSST